MTASAGTLARGVPATVLIDLPPTAGCAALRAALMAMRVPPQAMPADAQRRRQALARLADEPNAVAFIDISHRPGSPANGLLDLFSQVSPGAAQQRVMLTRLVGGHVSDADRQWVQELGFADLLPELSAQHVGGMLRQASDWAAHHTGLPVVPGEELARFVRAAVPQADQTGPRDLIRRRTGLAAEALAEQLGKLLDIRDRTWRLSTYPRCFVGSDAVQRIAAAWPCTRDEAVALGRALGQLGLLVHVVQEHPFLDERLFYRLAWHEAPAAVSLNTAWQTLSLPQGLECATRRYLGKAYPDCWVGHQAVDLLCARHRMNRLEAWLTMHRLMQFGLFEHVVREHGFIDGEFFYRFAGYQRAGA